MSFEITHDPIEAILNSGGRRHQTGLHHVCYNNSQWITWARRITGKPSLFLYYHKISKNFVLASWLNAARTLMVEIDCAEFPPDRSPSMWPARQDLLNLVKPVEVVKAETRRSTQEETWQKRENIKEKMHIRKEQGKQLRKEGDEQSAILMEAGVLPVIGDKEGGECLGMMQELFNHDSNKVISYK